MNSTLKFWLFVVGMVVIIVSVILGTLSLQARWERSKTYESLPPPSFYYQIGTTLDGTGRIVLSIETNGSVKACVLKVKEE